MIYDQVNNIDIYLGYLAKSPLRQALEWIQANHFQSLDTEELRCNPIRFQTLKASEKRYEAHRKYYDIHVVLSGEEHVRVCATADLIDCTEYVDDIYFGDYNGENDLQFKLRPGYFLVVFPEDAHKVGFHPDDENPRDVQKVVFKIKA